MPNDPEVIINLAIICAADSIGVLPDEMLRPTRKRNISHARFVAISATDKFSEITQREIATHFIGCIKRREVSTGIRAIKTAVEMYNRFGIITDIFIAYKKTIMEMGKDYKPRHWAKIPDIR